MVHGRITVATSLFLLLGATSVFAAAPTVEAVPGEYLVKVKDQKVFKQERALQALSADSVRVVSREHNIFLVKRNMLEKADYAISKLQTANAEIVEPNFIYHATKAPNNPMYGNLWGLHNTGQSNGVAGVDVDAERAWDITTGSKDVLVAVIDTGVDYTHPDIAPNIWTNKGEIPANQIDDDKNGYVDDIHGYDFANDKGDSMDDHGHGTHVSGTIGAKGNSGQGIVGVNWDVSIMGVKFLDANGSGTLENAIKAIDYATKMGAMIQSNSWGGGGLSELLKQSIERARDKDVLFVAAAGNESNDNDANPSYPCTYDVDNIVSVAAIDNTGAMADFSNYGLKTVHLAAPGVNVYSSVFGSKYDTYSGTSMATPHVSGIAALVKAVNPKFGYKELKARLIASAKPIATVRGKVATAGMANAYYAVTGEAPPPDPQDPMNWPTESNKLSSAHPYVDKANKTFTFTADGAKAIAVYFERFELEKNYDFVTFKDAKGNTVAQWTGVHNGEFSPAVAGGTITMTFSSDNSVDAYGFDVAKIAFKR